MASDRLGDIDKHFWLTRSTARIIGVSFSDAMAEGELSPHGFAEIVTRCRAADCSSKCELWLATQQSTPEKAPDFCANASTLEALRKSSKTRM